MHICIYSPVSILIELTFVLLYLSGLYYFTGIVESCDWSSAIEA